MLIRVGGGKDGIKTYLEKGHKQGRELSRDELDERVILAGDLEFTDKIISGMNINGERYLHVTLAFKEDEISYEIMLNIVRDFQTFAFSAYGVNEFNLYAEAHLPKIKSYINQTTGELIERKPHIHVVIPKINMLSGGFLNPFGMVEQNERFLDAFQEHINNTYGLASPKSNRRITFTNASDMIQRYKDDQFDGQNKELKTDILSAILDRHITDYDSFTALLSQFGDVRTRNAGRDNEYQNVKPQGDAKGVNLKDFVFERAFIELSEVDKHARLSAEIQRKYEVAERSRRDPANVIADLADWHGHRAMEIKYLNSGNKKLYQAYRTAAPEERIRLLAELSAKFYDKYQEPRNEPERFKRNPFEHAYGFKRPSRDRRQEPAGPDTRERPYGAEQAVSRREGRAGYEWGSEAPSRPSNEYPEGVVSENRRISADELTRRRIAFAAGRQHDPYPIAQGKATETINGVRTMSSIDVASDPGGPQVLLQDHARVQLDHGRADRVDPLRRYRDRQRERLNATGRPADTAIHQLIRDLGQREQLGAADTLAEFQQIKANLDAGRLLAQLSTSHGLLIDKYAISVAADGSGRIKCGNRNLNVSDFLTKEMRLPWAESATILRDAYARQEAKIPVLSPRQEPSQVLWRQFQDDRRRRGSQRQQLVQQLASERSRRAALQQALERGRQDAQVLPVTQRKMALSIARMQFVTADSTLKAAAGIERKRLRAPITEQYKIFLHGLASEGQGQALAELRRMLAAPLHRDMSNVGSIAPSDGMESNAMFYRGKQVKYLVQLNGDVIYFLAGRAIIQDNGERLLMLQTDRIAIETALRLAQAKFGDVLKVSGPKEFQERMARIAADAGIQITFQDHKVEQIRQQRASELASERARRAEHPAQSRKLIEQQRQPPSPVLPKKIDSPALPPSVNDKDKDTGPVR